MTAFTTKLAALAIAAAAIGAVSADASAKPMFKPIGPISKGPIFKGPIAKGPIFKGPIKVVKPIFPVKPIKPVFPIKPIGPKPHHHHHAGAFWVLGGVTILATAYEGCGYEYYKWKSTGSDFWLDKYRECRGWE